MPRWLRVIAQAIWPSRGNPTVGTREMGDAIEAALAGSD